MPVVFRPVAWSPIFYLILIPSFRALLLKLETGYFTARQTATTRAGYFMARIQRNGRKKLFMRNDSREWPIYNATPTAWIGSIVKEGKRSHGSKFIWLKLSHGSNLHSSKFIRLKFHMAQNSFGSNLSQMNFELCEFRSYTHPAPIFF